MIKSKIKSIKYLGKVKTYNLMMESKQHNYAVFSPSDKGNQNNYIFSANSHSAAYSLLSFWSAFLKAHYPEEFFCSLCNLEIKEKGQNWYEKIEIFEKDAEKNFDIKILPKKINTCGVFYTIVKKRNVSLGIMKSEIMPSLVAKGMGIESAEAIVKHKPYKDLKDFAMKTDSSIVDSEVFASLVDCGFFDEYMRIYKEKNKKTLTKEAFVAKFINLRNDLKVAARKGVVSTDLLGE